jgi:hypothetical protein
MEKRKVFEHFFPVRGKPHQHASLIAAIALTLNQSALNRAINKLYSTVMLEL